MLSSVHSKMLFFRKLYFSRLACQAKDFLIHSYSTLHSKLSALGFPPPLVVSTNPKPIHEDPAQPGPGEVVPGSDPPLLPTSCGEVWVLRSGCPSARGLAR